MLAKVIVVSCIRYWIFKCCSRWTYTDVTKGNSGIFYLVLDI